MEARSWTLVIHARIEVQSNTGEREYFAHHRHDGHGPLPDLLLMLSGAADLVPPWSLAVTESVPPDPLSSEFCESG